MKTLTSPIPRFGHGQRDRAAYSIIEFVCVLAIMAILAAIVTENVLEKLKRAARDNDRTTLASFVRGLTNQILRTKSIPGTSGWTQALALELSLPSAKVLLSGAGYPRYFLYDPACRIGTVNTQLPPYTQTVAGATQPISPRVMILSSLAQPLPSLTLNATTFSNLWQTPQGGVPAGWPSSWAGRGADLQIERLDLGYLFHRVVLNNHDVYRQAKYSIEGTNTLTSIAANGRAEMWYLDSTAINLHLDNGAIQAREFIHEDVSYVYENGRWGRYMWYGKNSLTGNFGQMVDLFLNAPTPANPKFCADQQAVVDDLYNYLWFFALWAWDGYPPEQNAAHPQVPEFRVSYDAQDRLGDFSDNLIN